MRNCVFRSNLICCFLIPGFSSVIVVVLRKVSRGLRWILLGGVRSLGTTEFVLMFFGCFIMASVFVISGVIALGVFVNPSHSILFLANSFFRRLIARPSSSTFYMNLSNSGSWPWMVPLLMTNMSSRNRNLEDIPSRVLSIVFWNVAGIPVRPKISFRNLYVPVALPPRMLNLHYFVIELSRAIWLFLRTKMSLGIVFFELCTGLLRQLCDRCSESDICFYVLHCFVF